MIKVSGFYNHFASKADLAVETIRYAFDQALAEIAGGDILSTGRPISMAERLAGYLSPDHRDEITGGCPTGSLPVDVGRQPVAAQKAFAEGLERYIELIEETFPPDILNTRTAAISTLSTLVGAMVLSRAVRDGDPDLSNELLQTSPSRV